MDINQQDLFFWTKLEKDLSINIPSHVKNGLHLCGFSNALSFKGIDDSDIDYVEDFIKQKLTKKLQAPEDDFHDTNIHLFGAYAANPEKFEFQRGERKLIRELVQHVKEVVDGAGKNEGLKNFRLDNADSNRHLIKHISVGKFFKQQKEICSAKIMCALKEMVEPVGPHIENSIANLARPEVKSKSHYFLNKLLTTADRNCTRAEGGYRYDTEIKVFSSYYRMISGPFAYETLHSNLKCALPSLSSTNRYIRDTNCRIAEGVLRFEELKLYLLERNLPLLVSLSEDATRIVGRVQYDPSTNQLVGFVLPINNVDGMPTPFVYQARDAEEIARNFFSDVPVASFVNVIMAQPLAECPPFCLLLFSSDSAYTSSDVSNRWTHITAQLQRLDIRVLTLSSDSDPKYNCAMRNLSQLGTESTLFPSNEWFRCGEGTWDTGPLCMQDQIHIMTKLRNFLLRTNKNPSKLPFGDKYHIQMQHLEYLLQAFSKDMHGLSPSVLNPSDKQNFLSVLRMISKRVTNLLAAEVEDSEGTIIFLDLMRDVMDSYMDKNLSPLERISKMWYSVFILRIWREYVLSQKKITLKNNFLTSNCYICIELNAHSLVKCMLFLKENNMSSYFLPHLYSSQPCEALFRQIRSFTSTYSTVANCSVKEILGRISKIQLQNDIVHAQSTSFIFPRTGKNKQVSQNHKIEFHLPTNGEISAEINKCKLRAIEKAQEVGLLAPGRKEKVLLPCNIQPYTPTPSIEKKIVPGNSSEKYLPKISNLSLTDFSEKFLQDEIKTTSPYAEITCQNGKRMVVKKTSLCWLWRKDYAKLSSDRLLRVQNSKSGSVKTSIRRKRKFKLSKFKCSKKNYIYK